MHIIRKNINTFKIPCIYTRPPLFNRGGHGTPSANDRLAVTRLCKSKTVASKMLPIYISVKKIKQIACFFWFSIVQVKYNQLARLMICYNAKCRRAGILMSRSLYIRFLLGQGELQEHVCYIFSRASFRL